MIHLILYFSTKTHSKTFSNWVCLSRISEKFMTVFEVFAIVLHVHAANTLHFVWSVVFSIVHQQELPTYDISRFKRRFV